MEQGADASAEPDKAAKVGREAQQTQGMLEVVQAVMLLRCHTFQCLHNSSTVSSVTIYINEGKSIFSLGFPFLFNTRRSVRHLI